MGMPHSTLFKVIPDKLQLMSQNNRQSMHYECKPLNLKQP